MDSVSKEERDELGQTLVAMSPAEAQPSQASDPAALGAVRVAGGRRRIRHIGRDGISTFGLLLSALWAVDCTCEPEGRGPSAGVARPLVFASASAAAGNSTAEPIRGPLGCEPGRHRCVGEKLEACDPAHGGWTQVNVCQTQAHCNAKLKQCLVDPCILGEYQCHGRELEQCDSNGWAVRRTCYPPERCDPEAGRCR